jgi:lysophospholipase L1-like esterase
MAKQNGRIATVFGIALAVALLSPCAPAAGEPLVRPGDRVLIFGDSISSGKGYGKIAIDLINAEQPELKLEWLEHGHPGWTAKGALAVIDDVIARKPTVVTLMWGTNDVGQDGARGVAEIGARLRALLEPLQAAGIRALLLTTPRTGSVGAYSQELNRSALPRMGAEIVALGRTLDVPVFDMFAAMRRADEAGRVEDPAFLMFSAPGDCHPNALGHQLMGRALADFLLGRSDVQHTPFLWAWPGQPEGVAQSAGSPAAGAARPGARPLVLDQERQVNEPERWQGPADLSARAFAAWDEERLHLMVEVADDVVLAGEQQPAWGHDGIEFFIDTRPPDKRDVAYAAGYFQFLVAVPATDGPAPVACGNMDKLDAAAVNATCTRTAAGYRLEVSVPWVQLRFTPAKGTDIGFNFAVNDRDEADRGRYKALWRGAGDDYVNAGATGLLRLE